MLSIIENTDSIKLKLDTYLRLYRHFYASNKKKSLDYAIKRLDLATQTNRLKTIASANADIGWYLTNSIETPNAAEPFLEKSLEVAEELNDSLQIGITLLYTGFMYQMKSYHTTAMSYYLKSPTYLEEHSNWLSFNYNLIGKIYEFQGIYDKSIKYHNKALYLRRNLSVPKDIAHSLKNIGWTYFKDKQYQKSITAFKECLKIAESLNIKRRMSFAYNGLGSNYLALKKADSALNHFEKSLSIAEAIKIDFNKSQTLVGMSNSYRQLGNLKKAEEYALESITFSKIHRYYDQLQDAYKALYEISKTKGNSLEALNYYELYNKISDSIASVETKTKIAEMELLYDIKNKEKELNELKSENIKNFNQLEKEKERTASQKKQIKNIISVSGLLLFLSTIILIFYRQRQKLKNNQIESLKTQQKLSNLKALIEGEEKERSRIAIDLHDGINGDLSAIKYKVTSINNNKLTKKENEEFDSAVTMLDNAIEQVRHISQNLVPPSLQNFDLIEALRQLCSKMESSSPSKIDFQSYGTYLKFNTEEETAIYRIVQELIYNSIKHANASEILVQINNHKNQLHLTVEDNGNGFDLEKNHDGLGLKNIESRVSFLRADLNIDSTKNGTTVTIEIHTEGIKQ